MLCGSRSHISGLSRQHVLTLFTASSLKTSAQSRLIVSDTSRNARKPGRPKKRDAADEPNTLSHDSRVTAGAKRTISKRDAGFKSLSDAAASDLSSPGRKNIPPRLLPHSSLNHHDLSSFLAYASRVGLDANSTTYKGTHYEYVVGESLSALNFALQRTGRSNDLGIDLVGHWNLPKRHMTEPTLRVLVQCKAVKPTPSVVRELEGAYVGAPAGWRGEGVLALLVASKEATKGVRDALQRSQWPMGILQVTTEGAVKQFLWNAVAAHAGLEGLGVTVRYEEGGSHASNEMRDVSEGKGLSKRSTYTEVHGSIALTWLGRPLKMLRLRDGDQPVHDHSSP